MLSHRRNSRRVLVTFAYLSGYEGVDESVRASESRSVWQLIFTGSMAFY